MTARLLLSALPALALAGAYALGLEEAARLFRADLAALVVSITLGAFVWDRKRDVWFVVASGVFVASSHVGFGGSLEGAGVLLALLFGCVAAAVGLRRLAEAVGAPHALAPVVAWTVLAVGMSGLFWARPRCGAVACRGAVRFPAGGVATRSRHGMCIWSSGL